MPEGRRVRSVSSTALIYCEGAHDLIFVRFLVHLYSRGRTSTTKFRTRQGKGGSPDTLVIEAMNVPGAFDRRLVKLDRDRSRAEIESAERLSSEHGIVMIWTTPCLEALLLSIIDGQDHSARSSQECKNLFETGHIRASKRTDSRAYEAVFTFEMVEDARQRIPELDQLILFITS